MGGGRPSGRPYRATASSRCGETQISIAAAASSVGTEIATVTKVAASRSSHCAGPAGDDPCRQREEEREQLGQGVRDQREQQHARAGAELGGDRRGPAADHVGLRAEREGGGADHEPDRERAGLLVHPARDTAALGRRERERAAGHEARDAGHRVQGEHERVPVEHGQVVVERRLGVVARDQVARHVGRGQLRDHVDRAEQPAGDQEAEGRPRPQHPPRMLVPAPQGQLCVVHALDEHEFVDAHPQTHRQCRAPA